MSCPKGSTTVAESFHIQWGTQLYDTDKNSKVLILNQKGAFKVSMSKAVLHQHKNKSFNKSQNREVWILAELLQCNVLGVILPATHLLRHTQTQPCSDMCKHMHTRNTNRVIQQNPQRRAAELCGGT